jgi:hypothetical protein
VGVQLVGAPLGLGLVAALAYFGLVGPRLVAAAEPPVSTRLRR